MAKTRNYYEPSQEADEAEMRMQLEGIKHQVEVLGWSVEAATKYAEMCGEMSNPLVKDYLETSRKQSKTDSSAD